jgi:hypothetical protein
MEVKGKGISKGKKMKEMSNLLDVLEALEKIINKCFKNFC